MARGQKGGGSRAIVRKRAARSAETTVRERGWSSLDHVVANLDSPAQAAADAPGLGMLVLYEAPALSPGAYELTRAPSTIPLESYRHQYHEYRLPNVHSLDARVGKVIKINHATINLDIDAFNLLNVGTILGREYDHGQGTGTNVLEIMNPRIVRFGLRLGFWFGQLPLKQGQNGGNGGQFCPLLPPISCTPTYWTARTNLRSSAHVLRR